MGAGGTRTHGRRIMSPLGILAVLADRCRFTPFLQVRWVDVCRCSSTLAGLFLSLRPQRGLNEAQRDQTEGLGDDRASSEKGVELARSGLTFQRAEAAPVDRVSRRHRSRHRRVLPHLSGVRVEQVSPEGGVLSIVAATPEWAPVPVGT